MFMAHLLCFPTIRISSSSQKSKWLSRVTLCKNKHGIIRINFHGSFPGVSCVFVWRTDGLRLSTDQRKCFLSSCVSLLTTAAARVHCGMSQTSLLLVVVSGRSVAFRCVFLLRQFLRGGFGFEREGRF